MIDEQVYLSAAQATKSLGSIGSGCTSLPMPGAWDAGSTFSTQKYKKTSLTDYSA